VPRISPFGRQTSNRLSPEDTQLLKNVMSGELDDHPPTIGVVGVSGVGKSSTINALFRAELETSDTVACTKRFWSLDVGLELSEKRLQQVAPAVRRELDDTKATLRVVDAPGLGEDIARDPAYLAEYGEHLGKCDVILWIMAARNRAVALDQRYLDELQVFNARMVFGLNQVDLVEPLDWHPVLNGPSEAQALNIDAIANDRRQRLAVVLKRDVTVIPYSAKIFYNLQQLFTTLIASAPKERRWIFSLLKGFRYDDFLTQEAREQLARVGGHTISSGLVSGNDN
jgi:predicted GTPase